MADETLADVAVQRLTRWKSTTMNSLFCRYRIADIDVEIIGNIRHRASQEARGMSRCTCHVRLSYGCRGMG